MNILLRSTLCTLLLQPCTTALAATVHRCEDPNGHVTFTLQGCPGEQQPQLQHLPTYKNYTVCLAIGI